MGRKIFYAVVVLAILGGILGYKMWNKPHVETATANADAIISPADLLREFTKDEAAANAKYLDKIIEVRGKVVLINKVENGGSLSLETGDPMATVICGFETLNGIGETKIGDEITVKGFCTGFLTDIVLERCSLK